MANEIDSLERLIEKHDAASSRFIRGKLALLIYSGYGITKYFPDHGPHMAKFNRFNHPVPDIE